MQVSVLDTCQYDNALWDAIKVSHFRPGERVSTHKGEVLHSLLNRDIIYGGEVRVQIEIS